MKRERLREEKRQCPHEDSDRSEQDIEKRRGKCPKARSDMRAVTRVGRISMSTWDRREASDLRATSGIATKQG